MSLYMCSVLALALICVLQTVAGDTSYIHVPKVREDGGIIYWDSPVSPEHKENTIRIPFPVMLIIGITCFIAILIVACAICRCLNRAAQGRVNTSTIHVVSSQPIQLNVHNLQQLAPQPASAPVVTCQKQPTVPPCPDMDLPPPYEVAVAYGGYSLQVPNNSASHSK